MIGEPPLGIERRPLPLVGRLLQPGPVALLTSRHRGRRNVVPTSWHMPLATNPPFLAVALPQESFSNDLIRAGEEFALNIAPRRLVHHVEYLQAMRGEDIDKFEATQLETFYPVYITAPLITDCVAWVECEVQTVEPIGDHVLYTALPRLLQVRPEIFDQQWNLAAAAADRPLLHLGGRNYATLGGAVEARPPAALDAPEQVLAQRILEDLEITREAQERREEAIGRLRDEVQAGGLVDLDALGLTPDALDPPEGDDAEGQRVPLDLSGAVILGEARSGEMRPGKTTPEQP